VSAAAHRPASRFVIRTPSLPFDVLERWGDAVADDAAARRELRRLIVDPAIREAVFVASPQLEATIAARESTPLRVPVTAIYSKRDGVVAWQACIDRCNPDVEHIEVFSSHVGLGFHAEVYALIAQRLAATPAPAAA